MEANSLMKELAARVGKAERPDPEIQRTLADTINLLPVNEGTPYMIIKATGNILREANLSVEEAITNYCNVRNARHDMWYRKIHDSRLTRWKTGGLEATFGDFMAKVVRVLNYDRTYDKMTPDFLMLDGNEIIIGDMTVTTSYMTAKQKKHEKYLPLKTILSSTGAQVTHVDFILKEDMSNLRQEVRKFADIGILPVGLDMAMEYAYSTAATELMVAIKDLCVDRNSFNKCLDKGKPVKGGVTYTILEDMLRDEVINTPFEPYEPTMTEDKIYKSVKDEVERLGGARYFDNAMEGVDEAFDTVIEKNMAKEQMAPKSTLKVVDNSHEYNEKVAHDLIEDYIKDLAYSDDSDVKFYILDLLPTLDQLRMMKKVKKDKMTQKEVKESVDMKESRVGGEYQYKRRTHGANPLTQDLEVKLKKGKNIRNEKSEPKVISMTGLETYSEDIDRSISYYGSLTNKPPILDDSWDAYNNLEAENTIEERKVYDYCRKTNGAQLCNSLSALYNRITHMGVRMGTYDNVFVPPNGSFICIMPKNHAPVTHRTCDMPFIFITRAPLKVPLHHIEYNYRHYSDNYVYYVSKLSRMNVAKIACWDNAGHRLVASASYIISKCDALKTQMDRVVGLLTYLIVDIHQKISEYLDLLKYISFMPFADLHVLPTLILDKCDLLMKTRMDAWMFKQIRMYIKELSNLDKLNARKPVMKLQNGIVLHDSLGLKMQLPSFFSLNVRHNDPTEFIEEIGIIFASRPKHLYGSQFLDESTTMTAKWDVEYDKEVKKYGGWCTTGMSNTPYPFDAKYTFHSDAIYYATQNLELNIDATETTIESHLFGGPYGSFLHTNCSLRGCTKDAKDRLNQDDMHTTSIDACLNHYKSLKFNDNDCRAISIGQDFCVSDEIMEFAMSEKDQRGGGRPIATPTLKTKAALMLIEKPEASIGTYTPNNILVAGRSKIKEQHVTYTTAISHGASMGLTQVYQLTEDQSKYSENDNPRKYETYLRSSKILKKDIRKLQLVALRKLYNRHHLIHRMPARITDDKELVTKTVVNANTRGVKATIGWPQGMLNNISTTIHSAADYWILKAFKNSYPNVKIHARGLVHSDDSWVTVCTNSLDDFKLFTLYRMIAKKLFCLKINEKKLWGGKYLGELVSNYNLNGKVHLATSKTLSNGLSNLTYQNWPIDVSTQISTIQQVYRTGATIGTLIMLSTILRQQIMSAYQISGKQKEHLYRLPVELGGYPKCSVFKLGVGGIDAMYDELANLYSRNPKEEYTKIVLGAVNVTRKYYAEVDLKTLGNDKDYAEIVMPSRGDIFKGIRYLMPKSRKLNHALKTIEEVTAQFPSDGLGLIITKPLTLAESLGHLRDSTLNSMYRLAAEKYTQSVRRLASSQAQQSSGNVVRMGHSNPMTMNTLYAHLVTYTHNSEDLEMVRMALNPENEVIHACSSIVDTAYLGPDVLPLRGNVINRMPGYETIYDTISPMSDVLLFMIDEHRPHTQGEQTLYEKYGTYKTSRGTLISDAKNIRARFDKYFVFHTIERACSMIMQSKLITDKERAWVQPKIHADTMVGFLKGLYGVSLNKNVRYTIEATVPYGKIHNHSAALVKSIYTTAVLNRIYDRQFPIESIEGKKVHDVLLTVDQSRLDRNDKLKLAVLRYELLDNRDLLDNIYESELFSYHWLKTQEYRDGRYRGDWTIAFRLGDLSGVIKREGGRVQLTVTEVRMHEILRAMRLIAERCFGKPYEYDTAWWLCPIWKNSVAPYTGLEYYLKRSSYFETNIVRTPDDSSLGITLNPNVIHHDHITRRVPDRYKIDNVLRTISVEFDHDTKVGRKYRMGSIFQDLTIPLRRSIILQPLFIQGFLNRTIYQNGMLEDLILSRHITTPANKLEEVLQTVQGVNKLVPVWTVFNNVYNKTKKMPVVIWEQLEARDVIEETWDCAPIGCQDMYDYQETVEVEKLENIVVEYETQAVKGQNKLKYIPDIMSTICKQMWGGLTDRNKHDFIYKTLSDPGIKEVLKERGIDDFKEVSDNIDAYAQYCPMTETLHSFMVGCGFNSKAFWDSVNKENLTSVKERPAPFYKEKELVAEFTSLIRSLLDFEPNVESSDEFGDMD